MTTSEQAGSGHRQSRARALLDLADAVLHAAGHLQTVAFQGRTEECQGRSARLDQLLRRLPCV